MKLDVKKILLGFSIILTSHFSSADVWKPMNSGLAAIPIISAPGNGYIAVITGGKMNDFGKEYSLHIWNGFSWGSPVSFHTDSMSQLKAMMPYNGSIYIAGTIDAVKGLEHVDNIFRFNLKERKFQSITTNTAIHNIKEINSLEVYDNKLVIAGAFTKIQNVQSNNLIFFNGSAWLHPGTGFGTGLDGTVTRMTVANDTLFIGGLFKNADQMFTQYYAGFYGGKWVRFENTVFPTSNMVYHDNSLVTTVKDGGSFRFHKVFHGKILPLNNGITAIYAVKQLAVFGKDIWAAGLFELDGSDELIYLIRYSEGKWVSAPGSAYMTNINNLVVSREKLYAGGRIFEPSLGLKNMAEFAPGLAAIQGRVFYDKNENCHFDNRDEFLGQHLVVIRPGNIYAKPNIFGQYRVFLPPGKYEINAVEKKYWTYSSCQPSYTLEIGSGTVHDSIDFAMVYQDIIEDVNVDITALGGWKARNGQRNFYALKYGNVGSENVHNGRLELKFDPSLGAGFQAFPAPDSIYTDHAVWLYNNLLAGETRKLSFSVEIPEAFPNQEVSYNAILSPTENEVFTEDNEANLSQVITDSSFENSKQIFPSPENGQSYAVISTNEQEIAFNINFANYSYDTVRTLYVIDTLDTDLDIQFIQETGASHNYSTKVINGPSGSNTAIVIWTFDGIDLNPNPLRISDMNNYSGYIGFKFRFNAPLPKGMIITNRARIILDYEYEEMTNQVEGRVQEVVSVEPLVTTGMVMVFPNPVTDGKLTITTENEIKTSDIDISFTDMLGRKWLPRQLNTEPLKLEAEVSHLPQGTYILNLEDKSGFAIRKRICIIQ